MVAVLAQEEGCGLEDIIEDEVLDEHRVLGVDDSIQTVQVEDIIHRGVGHGLDVVGVDVFDVGLHLPLFASAMD